VQLAKDHDLLTVGDFLEHRLAARSAGWPPSASGWEVSSSCVASERRAGVAASQRLSLGMALFWERATVEIS
jgi:hypothetical protein